MGKRLALGFLLLFIVYQASEGLQTVIAPGSPVGPVLMLLALLLAWPVGRWIDGSGWRAFGLVRRQWLGILAGGFAVAVLAKLAGEMTALGLGFEQYAPSVAVPLTALALLALTTFVPSLAEDILTRGVLLRFTPGPLGFWGYVLGSALLYTLNHVWRFDWGLSEQVRLFCLGLAYGAAAYRFGSLWAAVGLHWGWNFTTAALSQWLPGAMLDATGGRLASAGVHLLVFVLVAGWVRTPREAAEEHPQAGTPGGPGAGTAPPASGPLACSDRKIPA